MKDFIWNLLDLSFRCLYHNRSSFASLADSPFSLPPPPPETDPTAATFKIDPSFLSVDHQCSKEDFPCETIQTLADHCEEVWYTKWSPDGRRLATGSKDNTGVDTAQLCRHMKKNFAFYKFFRPFVFISGGITLILRLKMQEDSSNLRLKHWSNVVETSFTAEKVAVAKSAHRLLESGRNFLFSFNATYLRKGIQVVP